MLTPDTGDGAWLRRSVASYHCTATAYSPAGTAFLLGSRPARTPRLAVRWLHSRAHDIADQLDTAARTPVRHWTRNHDEHARALAQLAGGQPYIFTAFDDTIRYVLTAMPARSHHSPGSPA